MTRKGLSVLVFLSLGLPLVGCGGVPSVDSVRYEIERRLPGARFEPEEHIRLGRFTMALVRGVLRMVTDEEDSVPLLNEIRRVEVATYRVHSMPDLKGRLGAETGFREKLAEAGWSMALQEQDADSRTWLFVRNGDDGSLSNLYVVALDSAELTLVRLDGRLDHAFARAVAGDPDEVVRMVKTDS
jgi:hypothetical protein